MGIRKPTRPPGSPKTPGSGRKPGSVNKRTAALQQKAIELGVQPVDVMLLAMREAIDLADEAGTKVSRFAFLTKASELAAVVAPYIHPKLSAIAHSGPDGGPQQLEHGLSPKALEMVEAIKRGLEQSS